MSVVQMTWRFIRLSQVVFVSPVILIFCVNRRWVFVLVHRGSTAGPYFFDGPA